MQLTYQVLKGNPFIDISAQSLLQQVCVLMELGQVFGQIMLQLVLVIFLGTLGHDLSGLGLVFHSKLLHKPLHDVSLPTISVVHRNHDPGIRPS